MQVLWAGVCAAATGAAYLVYKHLVRQHRAATDGANGRGSRCERTAGGFSGRQLCKAIRGCAHGTDAIAVLRSNPGTADASACTAAVEVCGRCRDCSGLRGLLTKPKLAELGVAPTEALVAAAISAYGRSGQCQEALNLLETMHERLGLKPGPGCFTAAIGTEGTDVPRAHVRCTRSDPSTAC
jgi:pentatricopeptide repeat protein